MSLTTDGLAVGAAFAIAVGSAVQARQTYTELDARTPARTSLVPLILSVIRVWFSLLHAVGDQVPAFVILAVTEAIGLLGQTPTELTIAQIATLPPAQAAVLAAGKATVLTTNQVEALAKGDAAQLTPDQVNAMAAERAKDAEKWVGFLLAWIFILIGALAALAGAALTLANDL
jgi:hypothetical protein